MGPSLAQALRSGVKQQGMPAPRVRQASFATSNMRRRPVREIFTEIHSGDTPPGRGIAARGLCPAPPEYRDPQPGTVPREFAERGLNRVCAGNRAISELDPKSHDGSDQPWAHGIANQASDHCIYLFGWQFVFAVSFAECDYSLTSVLTVRREI
ncbi:hypothetical protein MHPYR_850002 [uncultured Mycobacterium sp.]|uniref:Uncharacterized protein n=1 Tax=uncultured Mycobacterium sp. TaxID=171292 RepID=A0A1Y5PLM4_9MYCO|nr:hypothetical protein MHPYR_850002 [uncultured Mycobacterium sp.]